MNDTPTLRLSTPEPLAMIRVVVAPSEMPRIVAPALQELVTVLAAQQVRPRGAWLTYHFRRPTDTFDVAICMPVAQPVAPMGRVQPGELPAVPVACTTHYGPYDELRAAWKALSDWIVAQGHTAAADRWERYVTGPDSLLAPSLWRTELSQPLRDAHTPRTG
ncbi:MAG: GyrI-like domain-containing protein [Gemmatimonadaceae bacterium]|jgi:effector-binding domain-containing protein|nr:GyrI-like domain-containing protein [Gemmatimonadaceae bacterium]